MLEEYLIDCCAPTLASMKMASMFNCRFDREEELHKWLDTWNKTFCKYGLHLYVLRKWDNAALVYVFRKSQLQSLLNRFCIRNFLGEHGYSMETSTHLYPCLQYLKKRIEESDSFPHEIGVFLGYPLCDVQGFIVNEGRNYKCAGPWKVYGNERETLCTFEKYKKCRSVYTRLWEGGQRSVVQMTVAG